MKLIRAALFGFGTLAVLAIASTGVNADGTRRSIKDGPERPFNWTGFYVGGQVGCVGRGRTQLLQRCTD